MFGLLARLDPEGRDLTLRLERAVNELGWAEVAWLIAEEPHELTVDSQRGRRGVHIRAVWDTDAWESDTYVWLTVDARVRGRRLRWRAHHGLAGHAGEDLPDRRPLPAAVDLASLARS